MNQTWVKVFSEISFLSVTGLFASDQDPLWEEKKHSQNEPDRINTNQGISRWTNFEWTEEDDKDLKEKNQGHPQWTMIREAFPRIRASETYRKTKRSQIPTH